MINIVRELEEWGRVARKLGPGTNWHEPDQFELTARFDGTNGNLDNAGFWPKDVSRAETGGYCLGYALDKHGAPTRGEMAIVISAETVDTDGVTYRGRDLAAVNIANLLGWAAEAAQLREQVAKLERRRAQLEQANEALRARVDASEVVETTETYIRLRW